MGIITAALIAGGNITEFNRMPNWVPIACYAAIGIGTMSGGWKIVKTMGTKITKVTPFEGVAAETAGAVNLICNRSIKDSCEYHTYYYRCHYGSGRYQKIICGKMGCNSQPGMGMGTYHSYQWLTGSRNLFYCKIVFIKTLSSIA